MTDDYSSKVNCPCCNQPVTMPMIVCESSFGVTCPNCKKWLRGTGKVKIEYRVWEDKK